MKITEGSIVKKWSISPEKNLSIETIFLEDIFGKGGEFLLSAPSEVASSRRLVVIDINLRDLYFENIQSFFLKNKIDAAYLFIEAEESTKDLENLHKILDACEELNLLRRSEPIIAIGGGVLMDIVGFAASQYRRGIPYIKVPTTLIGLIDASIGAKVAINFKGKRNRLGAYHPSHAAVLDKSFLNSLDPVHISAGLGEMIKIALIADLDFFEYLALNINDMFVSKLQHENSNHAIERSIELMLGELESNIWEEELARKVDFGHTFSPLLEMKSLEGAGDKAEVMSHGQAVALDVLVSSIIAVNRGILSNSFIPKLCKIIKDSGLYLAHPYFTDANLLWDALSDTKKHRNNNQYIPIPTDNGSIIINDLSRDELISACKRYALEIKQ